MKRFNHILIAVIAVLVSQTGYAAMIMDADDFEHDAVDAQPAKATLISPATPTANASVQVVDGTTNTAGTGNGVRLFDNSTGTGTQLEYDFTIIVDNPPTAELDKVARLSAVRVDLSFAPLNNTGAGDHYFSITLGEHLTSQSDSSRHFLDCRLLNDGTIDFVSTTGPSSTGHTVSGASTLSIFVNDYETAITYTGLDSVDYTLPANSVAYWLNGARIDFGGQGYTAMENRSTNNSTVFTSTNNLGRFAIVSTASSTGLDYVFDDIMITDLDSDQDPTGTSSLVSDSFPISYTGYSNQGESNPVNTVPDFSGAGYKGGGVPIPFIPAAVTLSDDGAADDTERIKVAIENVACLPVGPDGFRGAVVLEAGEYTVNETIAISTSGIVIRGAGSQENGGTRITFTSTATTNPPLFLVDNSAGAPVETAGTRTNITDAYVPVGAKSFNVVDASGYAPGDTIIIQMLVNDQWIIDIGMTDAELSPDAGWTTGYYQNMKYRRTVTEVNGNTITVDLPVVQTIQNLYGGADVYKYTYPGALENIGFECMRLESIYASDSDENHGWTGIRLKNLENGWVRQITTRYFVSNLVSISDFCRRITIEDCANLDPKGTTAGGRRYSFTFDDADSLLFQRCLTRGGRHDFASGSKVDGPNVYVDCRASETWNDIGPHHRYSTGQLYDNIFGGEMNVQNRLTSGSGHGWSGAQIMFWNCDASSITCDAPTGAMNWVVGSSAFQAESWRTPAEPFGIWESLNQAVSPRSLYYAQLIDRLGANSLKTVILPLQKESNVWTELFLWDGDGLFMDDVIAWADEEVIAEKNVPLTIGGVVRNLPMLDRGVTYSWAKDSGPGIVTFGNATSLDTTAAFDQTGTYVLELTVSDGTVQKSGLIEIEVFEDTTDPAVPTGLSLIAGDGRVFLNWEDNTDPDLVSYNVYRSETQGVYDFNNPLATGITSSEYMDENLVINGTEYHYVVTAVDVNSLESLASNEISATPQIDTTPPFAPANLNATPGDEVISLEWDDNVEPDLLRYDIYRSTTQGSYGAVLASTVPGSSNYIDNTVANGTTYYYTVVAVDVNYQGSTGNPEVSVTPQLDATPPAAPTGVAATEGFGRVTVSWDQNTEPDLVSYSIYRSATPGVYDYNNPLVENLTALCYVDGTGDIETIYYYEVTATDTRGNESASSAEVAAAPQATVLGLGTTLFGSNEARLRGFKTSTVKPSQESWTILPDSVRYINDDPDGVNSGSSGSTQNASLLREYAIDRSVGKSYTIQGVVNLTDGYADDNNRVGIYLFGDVPDLAAPGGLGGNETGALCLLNNLDQGTISLLEGLENPNPISSVSTGRVMDNTIFGNTVTFTAVITFVNSGGTDQIEITGTFKDEQNNETSVAATVAADYYTGNYFGFVTRARTRGLDTRTATFTMDYRSFKIIENQPPLADAGPDQTVIDTDENGSEDVTLDGGGSSDSDGTIVSYKWLEGGTEIATGVNPTVTLTFGVHTLTLVVTDDQGAFSQDEVTITVDDLQPNKPVGLSAIGDDGSIVLSWTPNTEPNLSGYSIYRSTTSGSGFGIIATVPNTSSRYVDSPVDNGTTYYYEVTATSSNGVSDRSDEASATPQPGLITIFGSENDGYDVLTFTYDGFTTSTPDIDTTVTPNIEIETWSETSESLRYSNGETANTGLVSSSLLKEFTLNRSAGSIYTIEGLVELTSGYSDDNNRVGIYLFGDVADIEGPGGSSTEAGALCLLFNFDQGALNLVEGINGTVLVSSVDTRSMDSSFFGDNKIATITAEISFLASGDIQIDGSFTAQYEDAGIPTEFTANITYTLAANDPLYGGNAMQYFEGDYFGFAARSRKRGEPGKDTPFVMDYRSFRVTDNTVTTFNNPPVLDPISDKNIDEGSELTFTASASDPDGDDLTFSLNVGAPTGATIDPLTGDFSWTPTEADGSQNFNITVRVSDDGVPSKEDSKMFNVAVAEVNNSPAFTTDPFTKTNARVDLAYSGTLEGDAADPEGDPMTFSLISAPTTPTWLSVAADGALSGTPSSGDLGLNTFTVRVDAAGGTDTATLYITVVEAGAVNNFEDSGNGLVGDGANWSTGLPSSSGNVGTISTGDSGLIGNYDPNDQNGGSSAETSAVGLFIEQEGGTVESESYRGSVLDNTSWNLTGGNLGSQGVILQNSSVLTMSGNGTLTVGSGRDLSVASGSTFTMDGGTASIGDEASILATMVMNAGTITVVKHIEVIGGGDFTINGGVITSGDFGTIGFSGGSPNTMNFNGGTLTADKFSFQNGSTATFGGANAGSVTFNTFADNDIGGTNYYRHSDAFIDINWLPGTQMSMTVTNVSDWAPALWADGRLTYNGQDYTTLGNWATVTSTGFGDGSRFAYDSVTNTLSIAAATANKAPVAVDDTATTDEDVAVAGNVLTNDTDADGDTLSVATASVGIFTTAEGGSITLAVDGSFTYTPAADFNGEDSFTYFANDGIADSATAATVTITINPVNDAPTVSLTNAIGSLAEDADTSSATFIADVVISDVDSGTNVLSLSGTHAGQFELVANVLYLKAGVTLDHETVSSLDVTVEVDDATIGAPGETEDSVNYNLSITDVNEAPVASADFATTNEDTPVTIDVLANDSDVDNDTLSISFASAISGAVNIVGNELEYTPNTNYNGADTIVYEISDGNGGIANATVDVTINSVNDAPVAVDDTATTDEDVVVAGNVLTNDTDAESDPLSASLNTDVTNGTLILNSNGAFTYTPDADFSGTDSFTYFANDSTANSATAATVTINVTAVNDVPAFTLNPFSTANATEDAAYSDTIAGSASDVDGDSLTYSKVSGPAWLIVAGDGSLSGTPTNGNVGSNSWTVSVSDGIAPAVEATLNIIVDEAAAPTMYVNSIVPQTINAGKGNKEAHVFVTIYDSQGSPLSGATVTVALTGAYNETISEGTSGPVVTDSSGVVELVSSGTAKGGISYTATIVDVTHPSYEYDSENSVTSASY